MDKKNETVRRALMFVGCDANGVGKFVDTWSKDQREYRVQMVCKDEEDAN